MQIGIDLGATKIEYVVLKDNGDETNRSRIDCPKDYLKIKDLALKEKQLKTIENWMLKKNLHQSVSSLNLDDINKTALNSGAIGGKLLGAGGGGYFLFIVDFFQAILEKLSPFL